MKKNFRIIGVAATIMLLAISCQKEKQTQIVTLKAGVESPAGKTYIQGTITHWNLDDEIMVNGNKLKVKDIRQVPGIQEGTSIEYGIIEGPWEGDLPGSGCYLCGISPASTQNRNTDDNDWYSLVSVPASQPFVFNGIMDNLPMACRTTDPNNLSFHQLTTIFRLGVYAEESRTVGKVVMEKITEKPDGLVGNIYYDDNPIAATFYYPHAGTDLQNVELVDAGSWNITVDCGKDGVVVDEEPTYFHFVTLPVQMGYGIIFHFYDQNNNEIATLNKSIAPGSSIEQARIYTLCENNTGTEAGLPYKLNWIE